MNPLVQSMFSFHVSLTSDPSKISAGKRRKPAVGTKLLRGAGKARGRGRGERGWDHDVLRLARGVCRCQEGAVSYLGKVFRLAG